MPRTGEFDIAWHDQSKSFTKQNKVDMNKVDMRDWICNIPGAVEFTKGLNDKNRMDLRLLLSLNE